MTTPLPHNVCISITGKIKLKTQRDGFIPRKYVYQRVGKGCGNIERRDNRDLQLRVNSAQLNPRTDEQIAVRKRLRAAVRAWKRSNEDRKEEYRTRAKNMNISGYNLFIKEFIARNSIEKYRTSRVKILYYGDSGSISKPTKTIKHILSGGKI